MAISPVSFQEGNFTMEELLNETGMDAVSVKPGDTVTGKVVGFDQNTKPESVIISMGAKSEGKILIHEFSAKPMVGDDVEALALAYDSETGLIKLSKRALEARRGWEVVSESFEKDLPVSGIIERQNAKGYFVNVNGVTLFLPHSHTGPIFSGGGKGKKPSLTGMTSMLVILELDHRKKSGVVSRKEYLEGENKEKWEKFMTTHKLGDIVPAKVVKHINIGTFMEIEGVLGFLHKNNLSWERNAGDVSKKLEIDSMINVRILEIDPESHKISLGLKQLTEDPWTTVSSRFQVGEKVSGVVTFIANYGAFVDLGGGIEGLLHVNEMSWTRKVNHAHEILKKAQDVDCVILSIDPENKKIALGLKQLYKNPWDDLKNSIRPGDVIDTNVKDVTHFGVFVAITDEIDGLVRKEDLSWSDVPDPKKEYKKGQEVQVKVIEINLEEKKIGCSIRHLLPNPYKELRQKYKRGTMVEGEITGIADFGVFIRLEGSFEGLLHVSSMVKEESENHKKMFKKGDKIKVVVRSIDPEQRKIAFSTRDIQTALERKEIEEYLDKNTATVPMASPFSGLKDVIGTPVK